MQNYAKVVDGTVYQHIESATQPDPSLGNWVPCGPEVGPDWTTTDNITFTAPVRVEPFVPQHATKRAFQNRFPKLSNGISTKYDAMRLFLDNDSYAASLGVTGVLLHSLRLLITTGVERLAASPYVDLSPTGEAAGLVALLMQPSIPAEFQLSQAEHDTMLNTPLADNERYRG